jgi:hypothetical protein
MRIDYNDCCHSAPRGCGMPAISSASSSSASSSSSTAWSTDKHQSRGCSRQKAAQCSGMPLACATHSLRSRHPPPRCTPHPRLSRTRHRQNTHLHRPTRSPHARQSWALYLQPCSNISGVVSLPARLDATLRPVSDSRLGALTCDMHWYHRWDVGRLTRIYETAVCFVRFLLPDCRSCRRSATRCHDDEVVNVRLLLITTAANTWLIRSAVVRDPAVQQSCPVCFD